MSPFFCFVTCLIPIIHISESISETCTDPSFRNPYDPRMGFNTHLGNAEYPLHPRNDEIIARVLDNIAITKIVWSRKVPIYVVDESTTWDTYDVIPFNTSEVWTTFRCPPPDLIGDEIGAFMWDASQDWPFIIFDPHHPTHGSFVEFRGFHTFIDHTTKIIYCESCGLFKYNNNGTILNPDDVTISDGQPFDGQGTGSGLSWPGVIRPQDVISGTIAHAIRMEYSSCDFLPTTYVLPAVKTIQPQGDSSGVPDSAKIEMGYRFRLSPDTNCDNRLAPMYQNNGIWYPPTQQHTDFLRMFCIAMREYGSIPSDGSSCRRFIFQGENDITANWSVILGSDVDDSTQSWSYLIRDYTTPGDNRYRDERYGIPWHKLTVLNDSMVGEINNCCLDNSSCTNTPSPTYTPYIDITPGPECVNENCCFKHRDINYTLRINQDNCIVYNCTFYGQSISSSDMISIYTKKDGNPTYNTSIESNYFYVETNQDAINIKDGSNTFIYKNWFGTTGSSNYGVVRIEQSIDSYIINNTFTDGIGQIAVMIRGTSVTSNINIYIENNLFYNVDYGVSIDMVTNTVIRNNEFINMTSDCVNWKYYGTTTNESDGVIIQNNHCINAARGIYVGDDIGQVIIDNNIIQHTTGSLSANGIEFSGYTLNAIVSNNIITDIKHNCIYVNEGNDNMQIFNNRLIGCHDASGIFTNSGGLLIKNNIIGEVNMGGTSGRAIYLLSYGTIDGNLIYNSSRRGISTSGAYQSVENNQWIIENNIIYNSNQDSIHLYVGSYSPLKAIVRFNTVINGIGDYSLFIDNTLNALDLYCNIFIATKNTRYYPITSFTNEYNNLLRTLANISFFDFIDHVNYNDLHLRTTSPAIAGCNGLNITKFPLPTYDYDNIVRKVNEDIDIGADQRSPIVLTNSPTDNTYEPTVFPTSHTIIIEASQTTKDGDCGEECNTNGIYDDKYRIVLTVIVNIFCFVCIN